MEKAEKKILKEWSRISEENKECHKERRPFQVGESGHQIKCCTLSNSWVFKKSFELNIIIAIYRILFLIIFPEIHDFPLIFVILTFIEMTYIF